VDLVAGSGLIARVLVSRLARSDGHFDREVVHDAVPLVIAAMSAGDLGGSTERELQGVIKLITDSTPELKGKELPLDCVADFRPRREVQRELGISCQGGYACD